ncbi:MAG: hypothetical protein ACRDT4_13740 [Micromonosporaceae bacterium]
MFLARDALEGGLLTRGQLRGGAWHRVLRGVYADSRLERDHGLAIRAAALLLPSGAAITGASAAWLWGARLAAPYDPVDVVAPRSFGPVKGLRIRGAALTASDIDVLGGIRLTTPERTAWELTMRRDLPDAVAVIDALLAADRLSASRLDAYLDTRRGARGWRMAAKAFGLVDGRAESPAESRLRVLLTLAGLPPPTPQREIRDHHGFVARVDLAWPEAAVAVEYDGVWHAAASQLRRDRQRLNRLLAAGWLVHHVTARDLYDPAPTIAAIRDLLRRRGLASA